jgi:alkanesulfonate monooxygenase SsuD/methylene tetrahydromethanopterin reductase-like flavin-dependent oxidoreductase (luciferase family)
MVLRHTYVGSDEADIVQASRELSTYYNYFGAWFRNERPVSQGLIERLSPEEMAANEMYAPALMRRNNVVGTVDEVVARLNRYQALGYDEYSFWIDSGMSFERKKASLERFIRDVAPEFREGR